MQNETKLPLRPKQKVCIDATVERCLNAHHAIVLIDGIPTQVSIGAVRDAEQSFEDAPKCDHPEHGLNCPHHPESNRDLALLKTYERIIDLLRDPHPGLFTWTKLLERDLDEIGFAPKGTQQAYREVSD